MQDLGKHLVGLYTSSTDGPEEGSLIGEDGRIKPLDPPDPDLVGGANIPLLKTAGESIPLKPASLVCELITNSEKSRTYFGVPSQPDSERRNTPDKYLPHVDTLLLVRIITEVHVSLVLFVCTYFAVLKNQDLCRTIFNGKRLSQQMARPPPVNLLDLKDFVAFTWRWKRRLFMVLSDIRHWFHQIPICDFLQRLFAIRLKIDGKLLLPMGWAWSPYICQTLAWILILHVPPGGKDFFGVDFEAMTALPRFIVSKDGRLFVTLLYDNIVHFSHLIPNSISLSRSGWIRITGFSTFGQNSSMCTAATAWSSRRKMNHLSA